MSLAPLRSPSGARRVVEGESSAVSMALYSPWMTGVIWVGGDRGLVPGP